MFNQVTIIGVGLIGGSLGMGVRARGLARTVMGVGRDESRLRQGVDGGALDYFTTDLGTGVTGADLVIIAVPVGMIVTMLQKALPYLKPGAIVTDVGSCKAAIVKAVEAIMPPDVHFVGGHPMAGSEQVGIGAANRYLFEGAYYIFTPTSHTDQEALRQVSTLARNLGCRVLEMDPQDHDRAVAAVSHLPHLLASTLVNTVGRIPGSEQALLLAAGGYRDTTRVAAGSPEMWRDILLTNREMVRAMINEFRTELDTIERTLAEGDPDQIQLWLREAQRRQENLPVRIKNSLNDLYQITITIPDRPGTIATVASTLAAHGLNISDIEILRVREGEGGTVRLAFTSERDLDRAEEILKLKGISVSRRD